jgi:hypothetical protein
MYEKVWITVDFVVTIDSRREMILFCVDGLNKGQRREEAELIQHANKVQVGIALGFFG